MQICRNIMGSTDEIRKDRNSFTAGSPSLLKLWLSNGLAERRRKLNPGETKWKGTELNVEQVR